MAFPVLMCIEVPPGGLSTEYSTKLRLGILNLPETAHYWYQDQVLGGGINALADPEGDLIFDTSMKAFDTGFHGLDAKQWGELIGANIYIFRSDIDEWASEVDAYANEVHVKLYGVNNAFEELTVQPKEMENLAKLSYRNPPPTPQDPIFLAECQGICQELSHTYSSYSQTKDLARL